MGTSKLGPGKLGPLLCFNFRNLTHIIEVYYIYSYLKWSEYS